MWKKKYLRSDETSYRTDKVSSKGRFAPNCKSWATSQMTHLVPWCWPGPGRRTWAWSCRSRRPRSWTGPRGQSPELDKYRLSFACPKLRQALYVFMILCVSSYLFQNSAHPMSPSLFNTNLTLTPRFLHSPWN